MIRVGLIGFGAIGSAIVADWDRLSADYELSVLCVRPAQAKSARQAVGDDVEIVTSTDDLLAVDVDLYVEAAGHGALLAIGEPALAAGKDLYTLSIGALADAALDERLSQASARGGGQLIVPPGALAGFDGLMTLREAGLESARYVSTKPPLAWRGTPAEGMVDLAALDRAVTFFSGSAREAARLFPKNANLAAAVALAGLGFEDTEVELVADPAATANTGRVEATTPNAKLVITLQGQSFEGNPKSSAIVSASVIASLRNARARLSFR
jgi:aspartate dehydrogenase